MSRLLLNNIRYPINVCKYQYCHINKQKFSSIKSSTLHYLTRNIKHKKQLDKYIEYHKVSGLFFGMTGSIGALLTFVMDECVTDNNYTDLQCFKLVMCMYLKSIAVGVVSFFVGPIYVPFYIMYNHKHLYTVICENIQKVKL